ncbi:MAG: amidase family protein [Gammaproteobacteria bacterium]
MKSGRMFVSPEEGKREDSFYITKKEVSPECEGSLDNLTFAVKDVIDIKGQKTSCGNPTWLNYHPASQKHAYCVQQLLTSGAKCFGKTILGEFCSGSTGINHFYGMTPNPKAPTRVPGGSSSGSASIVAAGIVDFSLGTDTAGSVRLPASFCGIYGFRPSYGIISMDGIQSFSPSFDTVGIFAGKIDVIERVLEVLYPHPPESKLEKIENFFVLEDCLLLAPLEQRRRIQKFIDESCEALGLKPKLIQLIDIHSKANEKEIGLSSVFREVLCGEIWENLAPWIKEVNLEFGKSTFVDFSYMASVTQEKMDAARKHMMLYSSALRSFLPPGSLLCIPTTPDVAPFRQAEYQQVNQFNYDKLRPLIALASVGGLPQATIPLECLDSPPLGVSLLSGFKQDYFLINSVKMILKILNEPKEEMRLKY